MLRKRWFGLTKEDSIYLEHILDEISAYMGLLGLSQFDIVHL